MTYYNITSILPYQRNFNFINSERSIGKTYSALMFLIQRALTKNEEFIYIVRTQKEKEGGALESATEKVRFEQFPDYDFSCDAECLYIGHGENKRVLARCIALTEASKTKNRSYPLVKWILFDEYLLDAFSDRYIAGWKEPDLLLKLYHTVDREQDKVVCLFLGNSISFYNPYHLHPAFSIGKTEKGGIWKSENVLFQWAEAPEELKAKKAKCKFLKMIEDTEYGKYAKNGEYAEDRVELIEKRPKSAKHRFNIISDSEIFGVWFDNSTNVYYVDNKYNLNAGFTYAATLNDHTPETRILQRGGNMDVILFAEAFKAGRGRFCSMPIQAKCLRWLHKIV